MRIHVFEFIGGGGLAGSPLPPHLAHEGDLMMAALVADLLELPGVQVSFARDARLASPAQLRGARVCWRAPGESADAAFEREIGAADAAWPIAPETGGELERCARAVVAAGRVLLGPSPDAIALATSKSATAARLARAGIDVVPCFDTPSSLAPIPGPWVVKPDDGAGCVGLRRLPGHEAAAVALARGPRGQVAQPWVDGEAMSLCVLAAPGRVDVLSVNRQLLRWAGPTLELAAIEVNCEPVTRPLHALAESAAAAVPGLQGFFGIDFVRNVAGPVVVEINPRLTSSYAGLRSALGLNVAARVLAAAAGKTLPPVCAAGRRVTLKFRPDAPH